jgi:hypothetical protein
MKRRVELAQKLHKKPELQPIFKLKCSQDVEFFMSNCIWTRDPEGKMGLGRQLPLILFDYMKTHWIRPWVRSLTKHRSRRAHEKGRRMRMSIDRMAFEVWKLRYLPGSHSWVATDTIDMLDQGEDWNSLFGKFRYMWRMCREAYPWMFPELPIHTEVNKAKYIRFPEWKVGGRPCDRAVWGNELYGFLPSEVGGRGGASRSGFVDEAGWCKDLAKFLDSIEDMTPDLVLASTPPEEITHPFSVKVHETLGYEVSTSHWTHDPVKSQGVYWDEEADHRGPHTQKWRSPAYEQELRDRTSQEVARNWDIDYMATAGLRCFLNFQTEVNCGSKDPNDPTFDLYDPSLPVQVWYDVGRGDPWSYIWVQEDMRKGHLNIVDYWMKDDVTMHWWVPLLLGWSWDQKRNWKTQPEKLPWIEAVPWRYSDEEQEIIRRWHKRRHWAPNGQYYKGPDLLIGDFQGAARTATDLHTVEERFDHYGVFCQSAPVSHKMDRLIEHADEVMLRTRISGRLVGVKPCGRWPSVDECFHYWRRMESLETGREAKPLHNEFSHTGTAFVYGSRWLPLHLGARLDKKAGRVIEELSVGPYTAQQMPEVNPHTGWL